MLGRTSVVKLSLVPSGRLSSNKLIAKIFNRDLYRDDYGAGFRIGTSLLLLRISSCISWIA
jgi:hypothetical protein